MKKWILACLALLIAVVAYAHTDDTTVGRLGLIHPDLGHEGGAPVHTKVRNAWTKVGDESNSRWKAISIVNTATGTITHSFNVAFADLTIVLYDGQDAAATRITEATTPDLTDFTVIANVGNPRDQIDITNVSGSDEDLTVLIIQTAPPASASESGLVSTGAQDLSGSKTFKNDVIVEGYVDYSVSEAANSAGTVTIDGTNGEYWTSTGSNITTFSLTIAEGQQITWVLICTGTITMAIPNTIYWAGATEPTACDTTRTVITFIKVNSAVYGVAIEDMQLVP